MSGAHQGLEHLLYEVKKVVVGQDHFLERVLVALLANGHLLVEGVPGLAKTLTVSTLARAMQGSFKRIQFTPDLVPADLIGTRVYNQKSGEFATVLGPVFANLVLADEINRAPAKVQSALLEVMQERQVTIAGVSHPVPRPFVVMATQNPIETEGTYALPEAQVDRFMMKVLVGYPSEDEEFVIVQRVTGMFAAIGAVTTTDELLAMQAEARRIYIDPALVTYAVRLVAASRNPAKAGLQDHSRLILYGASPRATIGMIEAGRALGLRGWAIFRKIVLPPAIRNVLPAMAGQFIVSIKDSSLVALISIQELTFMSSEVSSTTRRFFEVWLFAAALYFAVCFTCSMLFRTLERHWKLRA